MATWTRTKEEEKQSSTDKTGHSSAKRQGRTANWSERGREQPTPGPTDHPVLHLQRSHGNQAVQRQVRSGASQTKLRVNNPLQRIEDLLKEQFVDPEDPRLFERRQSLNAEFRSLNAADAYYLLGRIMSPTQEDVISERFQTLHRSPRRELFLILLDKLGHIEAENLHQTLTHAAETSAEQRLQARFQEMAPEKNVREELLERLHSKFSSAHLAPLGKKTPWVNLNDPNFKTTGSISPDNNCRACGGSEFNKLGVDWSTARNAMELRGDIAGHRSDAQYNFRRTMESGTWIKVGSWRQIEYDEPGTNDDATDADEDLTPGLNHIYVVDAPGFSSLNPTDVHSLPPTTSEYVRKHSFEEWVEVRIGTGPWSRASDICQWHSSVWLEKVNGNWQRKKGGLNEISPGFMPVGEQDTPW